MATGYWQDTKKTLFGILRSIFGSFVNLNTILTIWSRYFLAKIPNNCTHLYISMVERTTGLLLYYQGRRGRPRNFLSLDPFVFWAFKSLFLIQTLNQLNEHQSVQPWCSFPVSLATTKEGWRGCYSIRGSIHCILGREEPSEFFYWKSLVPNASGHTPRTCIPLQSTKTNSLCSLMWWIHEYTFFNGHFSIQCCFQARKDPSVVIVALLFRSFPAICFVSSNQDNHGVDHLLKAEFWSRIHYNWRVSCKVQGENTCTS